MGKLNLVKDLGLKDELTEKLLQLGYEHTFDLLYDIQTDKNFKCINSISLADIFSIREKITKSMTEEELIDTLIRIEFIHLKYNPEIYDRGLNFFKIYSRGYTHAEIGKAINISTSRVDQIMRKTKLEYEEYKKEAIKKYEKFQQTPSKF